MRNTRIVAATTALALLASGLPAHAADTTAGQKIYDGFCSACHQLKDYAGKSAADLETTLKGIVAGKIKHGKKLTLSDPDIVNVAAYLSSGKSN
jgi:mono/diheme cytochrome c family protein